MQVSNVLDHLEKLMALKTVIEQGSIRKASEELRITQPSLSVKIKTLEEQLGLQLLERTRRGIFPTTEGQKVLEYVYSIIDGAERLKVTLDEEQGSIQGHITIGIYDSVARYIWAEFYKYFSKKTPGISISLFTGRSKLIMDYLDNQKLDLALTVEPNDGFEIDVESLYTDTFSFYCSKELGEEHTLLSKKSSFFSLKDEKGVNVPLILFSHAIGLKKVPIERQLRNETTVDFVVHRIESFEIAHSFCKDGLGVALLPQKVAKKEFEAGTLVRVKMAKNIPLCFGEHFIGLSVLRANKNKPIVNLVTKELSSFVKNFWYPQGS